MSQSRELQLHIAQLEEIRALLNAMKNLALMEIHKLSRFQAMQSQVAAHIENTALDFLDFYPLLQLAHAGDAHICIVVGAERGFCGDFNESLIQAMASDGAYTGVIAVGTRLANKLADSPVEVSAELEGANVAEEAPAIMNRLIDVIGGLQKKHGALSLTAIYHDSAANQIAKRRLLPPFLQQDRRASRYGSPPVLNLEPTAFFSDLVDHYLFAVLHEIFYISLMAENHRRLQHLDGAVKHLDDETVNLRRKSQIYRQEEITEEIEVILLNAENL